MEYYHELITQKSWEELQHLVKIADFVLIGGWAVYLYTRILKSKDIDIIIEFGELPVLEKHYRLSKNERLKKYEAVKESVQIDIYLPHYSNLGIPVEELISRSRSVEGFKVLESNYLFALKIYTLAQRARTPRGQKDFLDLVSLINSQKVELTAVKKIIKEYQINKELLVFKDLLNENTDLPELNLNRHYFSKLKKEISSKLF